MSVVAAWIEEESRSELPLPIVGISKADRPNKRDNAISQPELMGLLKRLLLARWPSKPCRSVSPYLLFANTLVILDIKGSVTTSVSPIPPASPITRIIPAKFTPRAFSDPADSAMNGIQSRTIKHPAIKVLIALIAARSSRLSWLRRGKS